ncbi:MAG: fluoride efflux transporter CrcB [Candidatus Omnitrophica bacterium]|nr:fluoride efflux transporter CrcB [Candidatus Omnitrophota bacterium]
MLRFFVIGLGGAVGTMSRYFLSGVEHRFSNHLFPVNTLIVNLLGSLVIGFLWGLFERFAVPSQVRVFVFVGILGGFTTFSTFSLENFHLFKDGQIKVAIMNIIATNTLGVVLVFVGFVISKQLMVLFAK